MPPGLGRAPCCRETGVRDAMPVLPFGSLPFSGLPDRPRALRRSGRVGSAVGAPVWGAQGWGAAEGGSGEPGATGLGSAAPDGATAGGSLYQTVQR